jgi:RNA polymerase sigma factor (sigma-70 family)
MDRIAEGRRIRALPASREERLKVLAVLARTDRRALAKLLAELRPFVEALARKQRGQGVEDEDLVQIGMEGLIKAVQAYAPRRSAGFTTYAHRWIHGEMRRAISWQQRTIRVPELRFLEVWRDARVREMLHHKLGRTPTDRDVAEARDMPIEEVWRIAAENAPIASADVLMEAAEADEEDPDAGHRVSASHIIYLSPENRHDLTGEPERVAVRRGMSEGLQLEVRKSLRKLRNKDRRVVRMRFWDGLPRRVVAELEEITPKAVRVAEDRAEKTLRGDEKLRGFWRNYQN